MTGTVNSPTVLAQIETFVLQFADAKHVVYDPLSSSAILDAHERTHGARLLPRYRFDKAEVIVSFDADFLGTWSSPVEHTREYHEGRKLEVFLPRVSHHVQFESRMSLTGTKADERVVVAPGELPAVASQLAGEIAELTGERWASTATSETNIPAEKLKRLAQQLWAARGRSLVVSGSQDVEIQVLCNFLNHVLGNYGSTLDVERPSRQRQGSDLELESLLEELDRGTVQALLTWGVNPVYELPRGTELAETLRKIPLVVSFDERRSETADVARFVCPDHHYLESWGDREPIRGIVNILQPCVAPLGNTRALVETLAAWSGTPRPAYELVREHWRAHVFPRQKTNSPFQVFWDHAVHDGVVELHPVPSAGAAVRSDNAPRWDKLLPTPAAALPNAGEFSLVLYPKAGMLDGRHAYNPWLQELPDPITKMTWDNYACLSPSAAKELGLRDGDVVEVEAVSEDTAKLELPVVVQPGQHDRVVAVALGYGTKASERFANVGPQWLQRRPTLNRDGRVGKNAAPLLRMANGCLAYSGLSVKIRSTGRHEDLACTQTHHTITVPESLALPGGERRPAIQETTFAEYLRVQRGVEKHEESTRARRRPVAGGSPLYRTPLGHGHRSRCLHRLFGLRHRLPGGKQHPRGRQGRSPPPA